MSDMERARSALQYLDPAERELWVKMAYAIHTEFGENGYDIWADWSDGYKRPQSEVRATWKSCGKAKPGGTRINTLFYLAKEKGWKDAEGYKPPSAEEIAKRKAAAEKRAAEDAAEEAAAHAQAAKTATRIWEAGQQAVEHPYLTKKGVKPHGLRIGTWEVIDGKTGEVIEIPGCLLIPMRDRTRNLWSLQAIEPSGGKRYLRGGAKQGRFHVIGGKPQQHQGKPVFILAEGYATGATVHEATSHLVLCCFDSSNLLVVAEQLRERNADAIILFAGDNDLWGRKTDGTPTNPGVIAATKAAKEVGGLTVFPPFTEADQTGTNEKGNPTGPTDWNDWHALHGPESVAELVLAALPAAEQDPAPWDEPAGAAEYDEAAPAPSIPTDNSGEHLDEVDAAAHFTVLGYDRGEFFIFIHEQRQISSFRAGEFSDANLLMMAPLQWWEENFPSHEKAGGFNRKLVLDWLFRLAARRGIYDVSRVRGRGAWVDDGRVVYHQGSKLYVDGQPTDVTQIQSRFVYELARTEAAPAEQMLSDEDGKKLLDVAKLFRWSKPGAATLLAGWTFLAPVCGAIKWRPHIWLTGGAGCGKSTILNEYVSVCVGDAKVFAQGNSTEAGLRQKLKADAIPVLFDESEKNNEAEKRRMESILALIRQSSTDSVAQTYKGTTIGLSMNFHIRSMFCLASIQAGMENKADRDRLTKLSLLKPNDEKASTDNWKSIKEALYRIRRDEDLPSRLLRRAIDLLPVIQKNITVFTDAAAKVFGTQREGDQFGTLLAGAWCLTNQTVATEAQALGIIKASDWSEFTEGSEIDDPEKALNTIMEAKIVSKGDHISVGSLITVAAGYDVEGLQLEEKLALRLLRDHGITIQGKWLLFQNNSEALRKLVSGTQFEDDIKGQLLRVNGAERRPAARFASTVVQRCVGIPLKQILPEDDGPL